VQFSLDSAIRSVLDSVLKGHTLAANRTFLLEGHRLPAIVFLRSSEVHDV